MASPAGHAWKVWNTPDFWREKRVFLTGHTGFKGLLAVAMADKPRQQGPWLRAGAGRLNPACLICARIAERLETHTIADIRDQAALQRGNAQIGTLKSPSTWPAQSLVRYSCYARPNRDLCSKRHGHRHTSWKRLWET